LSRRGKSSRTHDRPIAVEKLFRRKPRAAHFSRFCRGAPDREILNLVKVMTATGGCRVSRKKMNEFDVPIDEIKAEIRESIEGPGRRIRAIRPQASG
jgi:hypothetical protein